MSTDCIGCLDCVTTCPVGGALSVQAAIPLADLVHRTAAEEATPMKVNRWVMPVLALVLLFGVIGAAQAAGLWADHRSRRGGRDGPGTVVGAAGGAGGGTGEGATSGRQGVDDDQPRRPTPSGLPVATVAELTGAADPAALDPATPLNQLESIVPGFTMSTFRDRIADGRRRSVAVTAAEPVGPGRAGMPRGAALRQPAVRRHRAGADVSGPTAAPPAARGPPGRAGPRRR